MNKVRLSTLLASVLLLVAISPSLATSSLNEHPLSSPTTIRVEPSPVSTPLGGILTVNVTVIDVSDLAGWEFKLFWRRERLNGTSIVERSFLNQVGSTYFNIMSFTDNYNSTHGLVWASAVLLGPGPGAYGSGTLATISFKAESGGSTGLWLSETMLVDSAAYPLPHATTSGMVFIIFHDIAITTITLSKTIVGEGYRIPVNVSVGNQGNYTETFQVTVYANSTSIASQNVTLTSGNSTIATFICDASGFVRGNYTISAHVPQILDEVDTLDNSLAADSEVCVTIPGDVDGDFDVDLYDAVKLLYHYGSRQGDSNFNPNYDIDNDGQIFLYDAVILLHHYGQKSP